MLKKTLYKTFEDENTKILLTKDNIIIKNKVDNKIYENKNKNIINKYVNYNKCNDYISKFSTISKILFYMSLFSLILINLLFLICFNSNYKKDSFSWLIFIILYIFNVFVHELFHILFFKNCCKSSIKFGFNFMFKIIPGIYVEMNDVQLLSKYDKNIIYLSGSLANMILVTIINTLNLYLYHSKSLSIINLIILMSTFWNLIPTINSDGYKVLSSYLNVFEYENKKTSFEQKIKIISIFAFILSLVISILKIIYFTV